MKKLTLIFAIICAIIYSKMPVFSQSKGMYVLCYHAFGDKKDPYTLPFSTLKANLQRLKEGGYKFVTFEDVINGNIHGTKNILVTIDDGNKSVYEAYFSIMKPLGIKPVLGIYPAIIGRVHYAMNWDELKKLSSEGCYIASHGYHHMYLSEKYSKEEPESFKKEIYYSKKVLEEKLGRKIEAMIYPFGVYSNIAISEMKNAGYKYGLCLTQKIAIVPFEDNFAIPRYMITKPNQKGLIAFFIKKAQDNGSISMDNQKTQEKVAKTDTKADIDTLVHYPQKISKMIPNDVIFMPGKDKTKSEDKKAAKKTKLKFKPYVHSEADLSKIKKENRKATPTTKKISGQELPHSKEKKHSLLKDIKDKFIAIEFKVTSFIYSFISLTATKTAAIKDRIMTIFS